MQPTPLQPRFDTDAHVAILRRSLKSALDAAWTASSDEQIVLIALASDLATEIKNLEEGK